MSPGAAPAGAPTTRLMPFGVLLDEAMVRTRRYLRRIVLPYGTALAVLNALLAAAQAGWMETILGADEGNGIDPLGFTSGCAMWILSLVIVGVSWYLYAAMCRAATDAVAGREVSAAASIRWVLAPARFATLFLAGLLTVVAYMCCIVPILYVGPMLALMVPAMAEEGVIGGAAISRSVSLTHHNPKRRFVSNPLVKALVLFVVTVLISVLLSMLITLPVQIAQQWAIFREAGAVEGSGSPALWVFWIQVPAAIVSSFISAATWLYSAFGVSLLYFDTRKRKEGMDLEAAMTALESQRAAAAPESGPSWT